VPGALFVGPSAALWLATTLGFEFGLGHFVAEKRWSTLLADYDRCAG
jgi:hypothetical protein